MKKKWTWIAVIATALALTMGCKTSSDATSGADSGQQTDPGGNEKAANAAADIATKAEKLRANTKTTIAEMKEDLDQLGAKVDESSDEAEEGAETAQTKLSQATRDAMAELKTEMQDFETKVDEAEVNTKEEYDAFETEVNETSDKLDQKLKSLRDKADAELEDAVDDDAPEDES